MSVKKQRDIITVGIKASMRDLIYDIPYYCFKLHVGKIKCMIKS